MFCLTRPDATMTTDANESVNMLNNYGIAKLLRGLQNGKDPGPDNLRNTDLTINIKITAECLSLIYNKSIKQGEQPLDWKTAHATPIYKSESQHSASTYRSISLTSIP